jgi:hypothetical protein
MRPNAQRTEPNRELVYDQEQDLEGDDAVDELVQQLLREDGVFLDELREVV